MKLRTRLTIALTLLLLAVIVTVGGVAIQSTRSVLLVQIDETLTGIRSRISPAMDAPNGMDVLDGMDDGGHPPEPLERSGDPAERDTAHLVITTDGELVFSEASGFTDSPDPLPDTDYLADLLAVDEPVTVPSEDGTITYRAFATYTVDGYIEVWAVPLDEVNAAVDRILGILLLAGGAVILIGATVTWLTIRQGLRPVDRMVDTAATIAEGDLTQRVPEAPPSTELGRLSSALNEMLAQIEDAFKHEQTAQEQLKQFVADASHELRTPIAAIQGYTELYRQGAFGEPEDLDNAMRRIGTSTSRMQRLVADLLLLAHLDQGQPIERRAVNLVGIVHDAVTDASVIDPDRSITVDSPDSLKVPGDDQKLHQVVTNLLANARVHTPPGTPVAVTLRADGDDAVLNIIDDGPGLPKEGAEKLFDRFYRVDSSRARQTGGSGLGLAIVSAIVGAHDGSVEAANEPGHGARFTVRIPLS